jgi:hypothetical protein
MSTYDGINKLMMMMTMTVGSANGRVQCTQEAIKLLAGESESVSAPHD